MAATQQHRDQLARLNIPPVNMPQPINFDGRQPMFSPALPTALQAGFHPPFSLSAQPLQTPMQPFFHPQPPGAPGRPSYHKGQPSIAHLVAAGIHPPNGMPMTPLAQSNFPPSMMLGGPPFQQFPQRNRRQASVSLGGPPKAVLGGPGGKHSPMPPNATATSPAANPKGKKVAVNLPVETIPSEDGKPSTRPSWARTPLPLAPDANLQVQPPECYSSEAYPADFWRYQIPNSIDVFLPGKAAWDVIKQRVIEEKLEKLGVERGSGSSVPHIHAPHARAASISSPADPALLYFKLNKLQQSQAPSSSNSLSTSPQPPLNLSPSPNSLPPRFQNRHGHSMSLAQPPSLQPPSYNPAASFNPFGPNATLGSDQIIHRSSPGATAPLENIIAPQGRVPVTVASLAPSTISSRPDSRPDFIRGFGLDIPEEVEEPEEEQIPAEANQDNDSVAAADADVDTVEESENEEGNADDLTTASQSKLHSRHVSRLSGALSLRSVGGALNNISALVDTGRSNSPKVVAVVDDQDQEAVGEWTGSEDLRVAGEVSEDESIGEWSNPSDEERARQQRVRRRLLRRAQLETETPRRLPNFPRPPETSFVPRPKDDDIVSNPSEEGRPSDPTQYLEVEYFQRPPSVSSNRSGRPLPLLPHSRGISSQFSTHDPALAHSRTASENLARPSVVQSHTSHNANSSISKPRRDSLNPHAKPFVFGSARQSGSWAPSAFGQAPSTSQEISVVGHSRAPSIGKPLNAAAQEFKPGGFTFRPPPGVPQMTFPTSEVPRPLPVPPGDAPVVSKQGREKRQRRGSSISLEEEMDGKGTMSSFRFPADSPSSARKSAPTTPRLGESRRQSSLNASAQPFTFSGFSSNLPFIPKETLPLPFSMVANAGSPEDTLQDDSPTKAEALQSDSLAEMDLPIPPAPKVKRAPIPLDFKHPVSKNTVPAGLFKALVNGGDERTRRTVRSRLSSREIFDHVARPSLDDMNVPTISNRDRVSRGRLVTDPGLREPSQDLDDFFSPAVKRRSSLPSALHSAGGSSMSGVSIPAVNLTTQMEIQRYEERLERLLDRKIETIRREMLQQKQAASGQSLSTSSEAMINDVISLFRAQLQDSATRGLEDSQLDARGELDFELIKDVVHQSHTESMTTLQRVLDDFVRRLEAQLQSTGRTSNEGIPSAEQLSARTLNTVVGAMAQINSRLDALQNNTTFERDTLIRDLMSVLGPALAVRSDPVDYDTLTHQLSQAVKPHISQLIDLASDKRETAGLIVDSLVPLLPIPGSMAPNFDSSALTAQLTSEIRKIAAPFDAFEMKEQVADLVIERLDSRLAVRDRIFNADTLAGKVTEGVTHLFEPVRQVADTMHSLVDGQQSLATRHEHLSSIHNDIVSLLSDLPTQLSSATEALDTARMDLQDRKEQPDKTVQSIASIVETLVTGQSSLSTQNSEVLSLQRDALNRLAALPEALTHATNVLQSTHAELHTAGDAHKHELEELRKLRLNNTELQVQLTKARGAHGQVRVEKEVANEKLKMVEAERDRLLQKIGGLEEEVDHKSDKISMLENRHSQLELALAQGLERLKAADVSGQTTQERISELEKANRDLGTDKQSLKAKVDALELQTKFLDHEKDSAVQALSNLRKEHEQLVAQQSHWDDLRQASEKIELLTSLIGQADNEELKELRRARDRSVAMESEFSVLQKRLKENETKVLNSERSASAVRQSLSQAQQRSSEWENRAKEYESKLEYTQTKLDQAEQTQSQLDADYSLARLQLEEREADERLAKDRENRLNSQVSTLDAQVARLQGELEKAKKQVVAPTPTYRKVENGMPHVLPRPDSRASTIFGDSRAGTPLAQMNGLARVSSRASSVQSNTQPSVKDSIHAVKSHKQYPELGPSTPKARRVFYRAPIASPTPSSVSLTPTQDEEGWWS